jgi:predicted ArsR family transcriptional regulator
MSESTLKLHEVRQQIIDYLKEKKQATVNELAEVVHLTPMAIRYHLNILQKDNLITTPVVRRPAGRGRPQQLYTLTEAADDLFPVNYYILADHLLAELKLKLGERGIEEIFNSIADRLAQEAPPARANQTIAARLDEVVAFLREKGFVVDWEAQDNAYLIHAYSCPYRQIVREYGQVCLLDKRIISAMLDTSPVRTACLTTGDGHCTYQVAAPIELILET